MVSQQHEILSRILLVPVFDPLLLASGETSIFPNGIESKNPPMLVFEREIAGSKVPVETLPLEPRIFEKVIEISMTARKHIMVRIQAPGSVVILFAREHGPIREEVVVVLFRPSGVVNISQMHDVLLTVGLFE